MDWRTLNNRVLAEPAPAPPSAPSATDVQRIIAALASTRTAALRTPAAMSLLLEIPEEQVSATLATLEQAGVAVPEWNGMAYVWRLAEASGAA